MALLTRQNRRMVTIDLSKLKTQTIMNSKHLRVRSCVCEMSRQRAALCGACHLTHFGYVVQIAGMGY
jgi:hypothetical protein